MAVKTETFMQREQEGSLLNSIQRQLQDPKKGFAIIEKPQAATVSEVALTRKLLTLDKNIGFISCEGQRKMVVFDGSKFEDARVMEVSLGEMSNNVGMALKDGFDVSAIKGKSNRGNCRQDICSLVLLKPVNPSRV